MFLPYSGMAVILFDGGESFEEIGNTLLTGPMLNLVKIAQAVSEKKEDILKLHNFIHEYRPVARADNPLGTKF